MSVRFDTRRPGPGLWTRRVSRAPVRRVYKARPALPVVCGIALACVIAFDAGVFADITLVDAVKRGDGQAVRALLQAKADGNSAEPDGTTALHWAVRRADFATADLLLKAGAKGGAANRYGITPLYLE